MGNRKVTRAPSQPFKITEACELISEEENNERLERLSRKILRILANPSKRTRGKRHEEVVARTVEEDLCGNLERTLGI